MIQILVTIGLGGVMGKFQVFKGADQFVPTAVRFVFFVGLPCMVLKAVGIAIDFYGEKMLWLYILAFLILRVIAVALSLLCVLGSNWKSRERLLGLGDVVVIWLCLTWISTVIMGVPISTAVSGSPDLGRYYGVLAAVSSFIFQLPVMLLMLESYSLDRDDGAIRDSSHTAELNRESVATQDEQAAAPIPTHENEIVAAVSHNDTDTNEKSLEVMESAVDVPKSSDEASSPKWWQLTGTKYVNRRDVWINVLKRVIHNPVLWGIFLGFVLSLSTVGPTYLNPASPDFVPGLGWINDTCTWLGDVVSPLSLFAMGLWMQRQGIRKLTSAVPPLKLALYMISKLILVPLVMVGLAKALALDNQSGRAAVLIASLPISLVSFPLGKQYGIGEAVLSANTAVGTILMLPTVLVWNVVMDSLGLFPIEQ
jgi:predicted permease